MGERDAVPVPARRKSRAGRSVSRIGILCLCFIFFRYLGFRLLQDTGPAYQFTVQIKRQLGPVRLQAVKGHTYRERFKTAGERVPRKRMRAAERFLRSRSGRRGMPERLSRCPENAYNDVRSVRLTTGQVCAAHRKIENDGNGSGCPERTGICVHALLQFCCSAQ